MSTPRNPANARHATAVRLPAVRGSGRMMGICTAGNNAEDEFDAHYEAAHPYVPTGGADLPQPGSPSMNLLVADPDSIGGWLRSKRTRKQPGKPDECPTCGGNGVIGTAKRDCPDLWHASFANRTGGAE